MSTIEVARFVVAVLVVSKANADIPGSDELLSLLQTNVGVLQDVDYADPPALWRSTVNGSREGGNATHVSDISRKLRDKAGCRGHMGDPHRFWSGIAGEFDGTDFARHHKNLLNKSGGFLNDLVCQNMSVANHSLLRDCESYPCADHRRHERRRNCTRYPTERDRFQAIMRALNGTANMFNALNVEYYLTAGTLIGEWRCGDLLPWSEDADIHVPVESMERAFLKIFQDKRENVPADVFITHEDNPIVPPELVVFSWGWESSYLKEQPFGIGDRATGFYMDVWTEEKGETVNGTRWVERFWKHAPGNCTLKPGYTTNRCFRYPKEFVYPLRSCSIAGVRHKCPRDTASFLHVEFGSGFAHVPEQYRKIY